MCIIKEIQKIKSINNDCLLNLMLMTILLYIILAYLLLFTALSNAACLHNVHFLPLILANAF